MQDFGKAVDAAVADAARKTVVMALRLACPTHDKDLVDPAEPHPVYGKVVGLLACPEPGCWVAVVVQLTEEEFVARGGVPS
jgi:hypothetical protein